MRFVISKRSASISLLVGVAAYYGSGVIRAQAGFSCPEVHPFEAKLITKMFNDDGTLTLQKACHYARFNDGSIKFDLLQTFPKEEPLFTEILNVTFGEWKFVDAITNSVMTLHVPPQKVLKVIADMSEACPDRDLRKLPTGGMVLGFKTVYMVDMVDFGASKVKDEQWISPDLDCFRLRRIETVGTGLNHNEEVSTSVVVGEPSPALLTVPSSFVERDPESINDLHKTATHGLPFLHEVSLKRFKAMYKDGR